MIIQYLVGIAIGLLISTLVNACIWFFRSREQTEGRYMVIADYGYSYEVVDVVEETDPEQALEVIFGDGENEQIFLSLDKHNGTLKVYEDTLADTSDFWNPE